MKKYFYLLLVLIPTISFAESYLVAIEGMHCEACAKSITKKLNTEFQNEDIKNVNVDFAAKKATFDANTIESDKIKVAIESLGFKVKSVKNSPSPKS